MVPRGCTAQTNSGQRLKSSAGSNNEHQICCKALPQPPRPPSNILAGAIPDVFLFIPHDFHSNVPQLCCKALPQPPRPPSNILAGAIPDVFLFIPHDFHSNVPQLVDCFFILISVIDTLLLFYDKYRFMNFSNSL